MVGVVIVHNSEVLLSKAYQTRYFKVNDLSSYADTVIISGNIANCTDITMCNRITIEA